MSFAIVMGYMIKHQYLNNSYFFLMLINIECHISRGATNNSFHCLFVYFLDESVKCPKVVKNAHQFL